MMPLRLASDKEKIKAKRLLQSSDYHQKYSQREIWDVMRTFWVIAPSMRQHENTCLNIIVIVLFVS